MKTERAQAEVDRRRTTSAFADAVSGETFDEARAVEAARLRMVSDERVRDAVTTALARMHALLDQEQRERLAYLIRTGVLVIGAQLADAPKSPIEEEPCDSYEC